MAKSCIALVTLWRRLVISSKFLYRYPTVVPHYIASFVKIGSGLGQLQPKTLLRPQK